MGEVHTHTHTHTNLSQFVERLMVWMICEINSEDLSFSTGFMFVCIIKCKCLKYVCGCMKVSGRWDSHSKITLASLTATIKVCLQVCHVSHPRPQVSLIRNNLSDLLSVQCGPFPVALLRHEYWVRISPSYTNSDCDNIQACISQVSQRCLMHGTIYI